MRYRAGFQKRLDEQKWNCVMTYLSHKERIPCLKGNELIEVEEDVEQCARKWFGTFQVCQCEDALLFGLYHVMHLAQDILKQHRLMSKTLHPVQLLLIEKLHQLKS